MIYIFFAVVFIIIAAHRYRFERQLAQMELDEERAKWNTAGPFKTENNTFEE